MPTTSSDTFTGTAGTTLAAHTADSGFSWQVLQTISGGTLQITPAGRLRCNSTSAAYGAQVPLGGADYTVQADFFIASMVGTGAHVITRADVNGTLFYSLAISPTAFVLYRWGNGNTPKQTVTVTPVVGETYTMALTTSGTTLSAVVTRLSDGFFLTSAGAWQAGAATSHSQTDTFYTGSGSAGVWIEAASLDTTGFQIDNFSVTCATAPATSGLVASGAFFSPYNWDSDGSGGPQGNNLQTSATYARTVNPGAYFRFNVSGTTAIWVHVDVSALVSASTSSSSYPGLSWRIDGTVRGRRELGPGDTKFLLATSQTTGSHVVEVVFSGFAVNFDVWTTPLNAIKVTGLSGDNGATWSAPTTRTGNVIIYGDSISCGVNVLNSGSVYSSNDGELGFAFVLGQALNVEFGVVGFSAQGYEVTGGGNAPTFPNSYTFYYGARSRLVGGVLVPAPTHVFNSHGVNGTVTSADVQTMLGNLRTVAPSANLFVCVPGNQVNQTALAAGTAAYKAAHPTDKAYLCDPGRNFFVTGFTSSDGTHPLAYGAGIFAAELAQLSMAATTTTITTGGGVLSPLNFNGGYSS